MTRTEDQDEAGVRESGRRIESFIHAQNQAGMAAIEKPGNADQGGEGEISRGVPRGATCVSPAPVKRPTAYPAAVDRLISEFTKLPGIAETLDWAAALTALGARKLEEGQVEETLGVLLKYQEDVAALKGGGAKMVLAEMRVG